MLRNIYVLIILVSSSLTAADNKSASSAASEKDVHAKAAAVAPNPNLTMAGKYGLLVPGIQEKFIVGAPFLTVKDFENARQRLENAKLGCNIVLHAPDRVTSLLVGEFNSNAETIVHFAEFVIAGAKKVAASNDKEAAAQAQQAKKELEEYVVSLDPQIRKEKEEHNRKGYEYLKAHEHDDFLND